jgi:tetratricopeptide (TPR) repeat protein
MRFCAPLILLMFCPGSEASRWQGQERSATASASPQARAEDIAATYRLGEAALSQRKPAEAIRYFERVHALRPADVPPLMRILECQLELKQPSAARQSLQKLQGMLEPGDPRLFETASLLARYGEYTAAIPIMEQVRLAFPGSYDVGYNLALAYFQSRQYERAAGVMHSLIKAYPRGEAYNLLATIQEERRNYLEAVRAFQTAAEMEPGNESYRFDYGFELLKHQTLQAAIAVFTSGVRDFPRSMRMRLGLACAYYFDRKPEEAAPVLLEAVRIEPKTPFAYLLLGKMFEAAQASQARIEEAFRSYLAKGPGDAWAYYHYARIRQRTVDAEPRRDYEPIRQSLNRALALNPKLAEAYVQLGIVSNREGRYKDALPYFEKAVRTNPGLDIAHFQLGQTYGRLGMTEKSKAEFDIFEKLKARNQADKDIIQFLVEQGSAHDK